MHLFLLIFHRSLMQLLTSQDYLTSLMLLLQKNIHRIHKRLLFSFSNLRLWFSISAKVLANLSLSVSNSSSGVSFLSSLFLFSDFLNFYLYFLYLHYHFLFLEYLTPHLWAFFYLYFFFNSSLSILFIW